MVFGKVYKVTLTLVNGALQRHMAMECILGLMATDMRVSGKCASSTEMEQIHSTQAMSIQASTSTESPKVKESTPGQTASTIMENSIKG